MRAVRPQARQPGNRHLQHGDIAQVLIFRSACIQAGGDDDAHFFSIPRCLGDSPGIRAFESLQEYPPLGWFTLLRTLPEDSTVRHTPWRRSHNVYREARPE